MPNKIIKDIHSPQNADTQGFSVARRCWQPPTVVIICTFLAFLPHFFTFVGTDIAVYYEIGRRLASDGELVLWVNYWDHKPPLIYVIFAAFTPLDHLLGNTWGLKIGAFAFYLSGALLAYAGLSRHCRQLSQKYLAALGVSLCVMLVLGWLDFAANGILMLLAIMFSFSGLTLAISAKTDRLAIAAGFLIGLAPFFRQTGLTGFAVLTIMVAVTYAQAQPVSYLCKTWCVSILTLVAGSLFILPTVGTDGYETLISFNMLYGQKFREITSVAAFFLQDKKAFIMFFVLFILIVINLWKAKGRQSKITWFVSIWLSIELISIIYQRKIQTFYVLGFLVPSVLALTMMAVIATRRWRAVNICILISLYTATLGINWSRTDLDVFHNRFIDQRDQPTGQIARMLSDNHGSTASIASLLVYGNRANLYTLAAGYGIKPYLWPAYTNPLNDQSMFAARTQEFIKECDQKGPNYIVYAGGPDWTPNSGRNERLENIISRDYLPLELPVQNGTQWPYKYTYRVYKKK